MPARFTTGAQLGEVAHGARACSAPASAPAPTVSALPPGEHALLINPLRLLKKAESSPAVRARHDVLAHQKRGRADSLMRVST